jgi:hypothetical protein
MGRRRRVVDSRESTPEVCPASETDDTAAEDLPDATKRVLDLLVELAVAEWTRRERK